MAKNVLSIIEIIFDKFTVADSLGAAVVAPSDPPPAKKAKTARKDRHSAPIAGSAAPLSHHTTPLRTTPHRVVMLVAWGSMGWHGAA
jgi:hypothetical protein